MKNSTKRSATRVLISIIYIVWALRAPVDAYNAVLAMHWEGILVAAAEVIMLLAGIFGLFSLKPSLCRVFGIITFICSLVSLAWGIVSGGILNFDIDLLVTALLGWLFVLAV